MPNESLTVRPDRAESDVGARVRRALRDVADFPRPGILFKDITPLLGDAELFVAATRDLAARFAGDAITHVVAIESRGFLFGAPIAQHLDAALLPARKPGRLPAATLRQSYALEYGEDALEMHADACAGTRASPARARVLIVDDVLATGGTAAAARALVDRLDADVVGFAFVAEIGVLAGRARLGELRVETLTIV